MILNEIKLDIQGQWPYNGFIVKEKDMTGTQLKAIIVKMTQADAERANKLIIEGKTRAFMNLIAKYEEA